MTRINLVMVHELADQHLMAEYREITMVPAALLRALRTKTPEAIVKSIPEAFTLNTGHVRFFYNKMMYLRRRYILLQDELSDRGYNLDPNRQFTRSWSALEVIPQINWWPSNEDREIVRTRITAKPEWYRYKGQPYVWSRLQA